MRVLVLVHAVRTPGEAGTHTLLLRRLQQRGAQMTTIAWDRGMAFLDLERFGPVHEVEAINRWRLPQVLARFGARPLARQLRQRRVRRWWRDAGDPDAVIVLGPIRAELAHYVPPGHRPTSLLHGWRELEGAESLEVTLALVDRTVTPADLTGIVDGGRPEGAPAARTGPLRVTGIGPGDWRGAPDLFLRAVAALPTTIEGRAIDLSWVGLDPGDGRSYPYLYDAEHLGLADRMRWVHEPEPALDAVGTADVVVLTGRADVALPVHPFLDAVGPATFFPATGIPVVAFRTPLADRVPTAVVVDYPDVAAMADAVATALRASPPAGLDRAVDPVVDHLLRAPT